MKITALYERLSNDDGAFGDSVSIVNQKELLEAYAEEHGYVPFRHYTDDGYTGTNFHRPAFREMLDMVQQGQVERIIVKDLSRFGRDYLRTGFYADVLFPELGVHFIAVHSHVDSADPRSMDHLPFLSIFADITNRQRGRKRKVYYDTQRKNGIPMKQVLLYGYRPDPEDPTRFVPDPETAPIVQEVFRRRLSGEAPGSIAEDLNRRNIPTRGVYRDRELLGMDRPRRVQAEDGKNRWSSDAVCILLSREEYTGVRILGKTRRTGSIQVPSEDRVRLEGHHEPLITPEEFRKVRERIRGPSEESRRLRQNDVPLGIDGRILCSRCRYPLTSIATKKRNAIEYCCPRCLQETRGSQLHLYKEDLMRILPAVLEACWPARGLRLSDLHPDTAGNRSELRRAFEATPDLEEFARSRAALRYLDARELRLMEEERMNRQAEQLLSPALDRRHLALCCERVLWHSVLPEIAVRIRGSYWEQAITVCTLFDPPKGAFSMVWERSHRKYHVTVRPAGEGLPSLEEHLSEALRRDLLEDRALRLRKEPS